MPTHLLHMPTHLPCMREDLDLLLARAPWRIPMMLPQAAQTTLTRLLSQATQTIGTDEESNSSQPSCKLLNLHFHSNFALLPYLQLQQKNIQLLLMTMKLRMKMEKLKGLLSVSHAIHQCLGDN